MSAKVKWFIAIGILVNVILCAGLYANYRLDQVVSSLNRPGVLFSEAQSGSGDKVTPPSNSDIASGVVNKIGRPIEKGDLIKAGLIILRRLDGAEISYLYQVGRKSSFSNEERVQVRKILLNKLSSDDIVTLQALGEKYGRELSILDQ